MFIRSERLFLRPGWPEDWEEIFGGIADEGVVRNLAKAPWPYEASHARDFAARPQDGRTPHFLVTLPGADGARVIGCIGLQRDEAGEVELGYWFARAHWGQGFATEAARAVLSLARAIGHRRVVAGHFVDNPASGRVLVKAGFRPSGSVRQRFSVGRGVEVPSLAYAVELGEPGDCDDGGDAMRQRAA
ncbi:MAG TPA: GNAT family N-acetyltransferase [Novosphingobium sp.]|nr:GNAT family N-acetyltransferase [Novosphingobium sp.]